METLEKYKPLNTKEKIDSLISELQANRTQMTESNYQLLLQNITKYKLQMYLIEKKGLFNYKPTDAPAKKTTNMDRHDQQKPGVEIWDDFFPVDSLSEEKKYIYGTYIEMAFHNLYVTLSHIYSKVFARDIMKEAEAAFNSSPDNIMKDWTWNQDFGNEKYVWNPMLQCMREADVEKKQKLEELLYKHFGFLTPALEYTRSHDNYKSYRPIDVIRDLSAFLRVTRNLYSHYKFEYRNRQRAALGNNAGLVFGILEMVYTGAKRETKSRFALTDNDMACTEQYSYRTDFKKLDDKGRPTKVKQEIPGFAYQRYKKNAKGKKCITEFGLLLFTSLFLEKKYSKIFADKIHVCKKADSHVITEMLAIYRTRIHIQKTSVFKNTDALALDILTELRKCPMELFELLRPEDQKKFRINCSDDESSDNEVLMVRHSDRFAYFVMKYIDDANLFRDIRFQVSLGKYFYRFYNKKCIDDSPEMRVRAISKDVHGFGRITEIEDARRNVWEKYLREYDDIHENTVDESPYITDHSASYVFNANRIGLRIRNNEEETSTFIPELTDDGVRNLPPTCWLSTYELPALVFLMMLTDAKTVEDIIKQKICALRQVFTDIKDGILVPQQEESIEQILRDRYNGLRMSEIPKNMLDYLTGQQIDIEKEYRSWAGGVLDDMIEQSEHKLVKISDDLKKISPEETNSGGKKKAGAKENKIGKKGYVCIKPGRIADWLAKDIMLFQPNDAENKNKLTSLNFRILQASLAQYSDGNFGNLRRLFESAGLINQKDESLCNPIITNLCRRKKTPGNTVEFYKAYLAERKAYLRQCKDCDDKRNLFFLYADRRKWNEHNAEFYRNLAERYLHEEYCGTEYDKSIELPRGLFEDTIRNILSTNPNSSIRSVASDQSKNMAYIIYNYFMNAKKDDCQPFYNYDRGYQIFNTLFRKRPSDPKEFRSMKDIYSMLNRKSANSLKKTIDNYIGHLRVDCNDRTSLEEKKKKESDRLLGMLANLKHTETDIKRYKVQDMLLFFIAQSILIDKEEGDNEGIRRSSFRQMHLKEMTDGNILEKRISVEVLVRGKWGKNKFVVQEDMKLKDYPKFYGVLSDRRMPSLLQIVKDNRIVKEQIEKELDSYDKVHPQILKEIFAVEADYYKNSGGNETLKFGKILESFGRYSADSQSELKKIRNSFSHMSYPEDSDPVSEAELPKKASTMADVFTDNIKMTDTTE